MRVLLRTGALVSCVVLGRYLYDILSQHDPSTINVAIVIASLTAFAYCAVKESKVEENV